MKLTTFPDRERWSFSLRILQKKNTLRQHPHYMERSFVGMSFTGRLGRNPISTQIAKPFAVLRAKSPDLTSQKLLPTVINYLDNHFLEPDNADMLSLRFDYSYSHICKVFKSVYKTSPGAYLHKKRMEYAQEAVSAGRKLSDISEALGYSSIFNFSRAYKKHFGVSPSHDRPNCLRK